MHNIEETAAATGLSVEDIRLILSDVREDWESCQTLTGTEYALILQSAQAKERGASIIAPLPAADMPLEAQQKLVENAAQVLNTRMTLVIEEEIALMDALERAKNHIILHNREQRRRELAEQIGADWRVTKDACLDGLRNLGAHSLPESKVSPDSLDAKREIADILGKWGVGTWP